MVLNQIKVNGTSSDSVPIKSLKKNQINAKIYGKGYLEKHTQYISSLANSIKENGLDHAIEVCNDKRTIIGGHHRLAALKLLGVGVVPIIVHDVISPEYLLNNVLGTMGLLARNNMQQDYSEYERYEQSDEYLNAFKKENKRSATKAEYESQFGNFINFPWLKVKMVEKLKEGYNHADHGFIAQREELLKDVEAGKHSITWCISTQIKDHKAKVDTVQRPRYDSHDNLELKESVVRSLKYAQKFVQDIKDYTVDIDGESISLGADQDDATLAGLLHGGVVKTLPTILEQDLGIKSVAPDMGSHFDVLAEAYQDSLEGYPWELEVKTTAGPKGNWTTGSEKVGYTLYVATNKSFSRFFAAYVYTPAEYKDYQLNKTSKTLELIDKRPWVGGGAIKTKKLSKNTLQRLIKKGYGKVLMGELEFNSKNAQVSIHLDGLSK